MPSIDLAIQNFSVTLDGNGTATSSVPIKLVDSSNANVTLSTPVFTAFMAPQGQAAAGTFTNPPTVTLISNAAGKAVISLLANSGTPPGSYNALVSVTPSGGTDQVVASGTVTIK